MAKKPAPEDDSSAQHNPPRRMTRRPRRATVAGTGPAAADGPEPRLDDVQPTDKQAKKKAPLSERDRWMLDEKPPHY